MMVAGAEICNFVGVRKKSTRLGKIVTVHAIKAYEAVEI